MVGRNDAAIIIEGTTPDDSIPSASPDATAPGGSGPRTLADGTIIIDPASVGNDSRSASDSGDGEPRKRRGRPRGSRNAGPRQTKANTRIDVTGLELILLNMHAMLAGITKTEELAIEESEAHQLAEGIANVGRHYDMAMSAKAIDWISLCMVLGAVYGPRIAALRIKSMIAKSNRARPTGSGEGLRPSPDLDPAGPTFLRPDPMAPKPAAKPGTRTININGENIEVPFDG